MARRGPDDKPSSSGVRDAEADVHSDTRRNATHASTTDPEAKLYREGEGVEARLAFLGHARMENRRGLGVEACLTKANGHAERLAAPAVTEKHADQPHAGMPPGALDEERRGGQDDQGEMDGQRWHGIIAWWGHHQPNRHARFITLPRRAARRIGQRRAEYLI